LAVAQETRLRSPAKRWQQGEQHDAFSVSLLLVATHAPVWGGIPSFAYCHMICSMAGLPRLSVTGTNKVNRIMCKPAPEESQVDDCRHAEAVA
jgi:hypothetical protein